MRTLEGPVAGLGKWADPTVPKRGWLCVGTDDLGEPSAVCEMCERQEIRFVHEMMHRDYPGPLRCGCVCAGHMECDPDRARSRDEVMRGAARRRHAWPDRAGWKTSRNGNSMMRSDGYLITVFPKSERWKVCLSRSNSLKPLYSARDYPTIRAAKLGAFDIIEFRKAGHLLPF